MGLNIRDHHDILPWEENEVADDWIEHHGFPLTLTPLEVALEELEIEERMRRSAAAHRARMERGA